MKSSSLILVNVNLQRSSQITTYALQWFLILIATLWTTILAKPEQIRLSLGTHEYEMVVTWSTVHLEQTSEPIVMYGLNQSNLVSTANAEATDYSTLLRKYFTYRALLQELKPNTVYYYQVGDGKPNSTSGIYSFQTLKSGHQWSPRLIVLGDLGLTNARSLPSLKKVVQDEEVDVLFHIGDFAYDLNDRGGLRGDDFLNMMEPITSRVPYMVCPGNHEAFANFSDYDSRFSMIGDRHRPERSSAALNDRVNNHYWSVDIGPAHIINFSSEFYYTSTTFDHSLIRWQYQFLEEDLKRANANRDKRPWIIAMSHQSFYCLLRFDPYCNFFLTQRPALRRGVISGNGQKREFGLENLFYRYGVDLIMNGHEHYYFRTLPLFNFMVKNGTNPDNPYEDPNGPTYITTGCAGSHELQSQFFSIPNWVAFNKKAYGYTRLTFPRQNHLLLEQISVVKNDSVIDTVNLIKSNSRPVWMPKSSNV